MNEVSQASLTRIPIALLLGWLVPGLGHIFIRHRTRGLIFLVTITATFWTGVAVGGMRSTVNPNERKLWFVAQLGTGGNTLLAWAGHEATKKSSDSQSDSVSQKSFAHWKSLDVAIHYTGVAGLLNVLVLLDLMARSELRKKSPSLEVETVTRGGSP